MNDKEKGLAELVMYTIHIDSPHEVEQSFADYLEQVKILGKEKDNELLDKISLSYTNYQIKKAKENSK